MKTVDDHCRQLKVEADGLASEADLQTCVNHLQAFNFGRSVGRCESAQTDIWLRVRWLLLGAAVGVTLAAVCLQVFFSGPFLR